MTQDAQPPEKPPQHWRKVHKRKNPEHLYAEDIDEGRPNAMVDVEVSDCNVEIVTNEDGTKEGPTLSFAGKRKRLWCNVTNCKTMEKLCGTPDFTQWRGWVTLVNVANVGRDKVTAIRIAPKRPAGKGAK